MKIIKNDLEPLVETWDDPGDYPSNAGSGPLPSYQYLAGCEGELILELTDEELVDFKEDNKEFLNNADIKLPRGILSVTWQVDSIVGNRITLVIPDCESDPTYDDGDYGD